MLLRLDERAASRQPRFTEYGVTYNSFRPPVDKTMPTMLGLQYYPQLGRLPSGFRAYNTPPILSLETQEYSRFAYDDIPTVERGLPWDRIRKSQSIG